MDRNEKQNSFRSTRSTRGMGKALKRKSILLRISVLFNVILLVAVLLLLLDRKNTAIPSDPLIQTDQTDRRTEKPLQTETESDQLQAESDSELRQTELLQTKLPAEIPGTEGAIEFEEKQTNGFENEIQKTVFDSDGSMYGMQSESETKSETNRNTAS